MNFPKCESGSSQRNLLLYSGGVGALTTLIFTALGFSTFMLIRDDALSEVLAYAALLVALLAHTPTITGLYILFRPLQPRLSRVMLYASVVGFSALLLLPSMYLLTGKEIYSIPQQPLVILWYILLLGCSVGQIIAGIMIYHWYPAYPRLSYRALLGSVAWIIFTILSSLSLSWFSIISMLCYIYSTSIIFLIVMQTAWLLGLAGFLFAASRKNQIAPFIPQE